MTVLLRLGSSAGPDGSPVPWLKVRAVADGATGDEIDMVLALPGGQIVRPTGGRRQARAVVRGTDQIAAVLRAWGDDDTYEPLARQLQTRMRLAERRRGDNPTRRSESRRMGSGQAVQRALSALLCAADPSLTVASRALAVPPGPHGPGPRFYGGLALGAVDNAAALVTSRRLSVFVCCSDRQSAAALLHAAAQYAAIADRIVLVRDLGRPCDVDLAVLPAGWGVLDVDVTRRVEAWRRRADQLTPDPERVAQLLTNDDMRDLLARRRIVTTSRLRGPELTRRVVTEVPAAELLSFARARSARRWAMTAPTPRMVTHNLL